jgi:hypothetical protein
MSDDNVRSLNIARALKGADNRLWSPVDCLQDAIADVEKGDKPCNKLIVIRIFADDEKFDVGYHSANIKASEIISALECLKLHILQEMGY